MVLPRPAQKPSGAIRPWAASANLRNWLGPPYSWPAPPPAALSLGRIYESMEDSFLRRSEFIANCKLSKANQNHSQFKIFNFQILSDTNSNPDLRDNCRRMSALFLQRSPR